MRFLNTRNLSLALRVASTSLICLVAVARLAGSESDERLALAHYMPWYEAKPYSPQWGWHWTMNNAFDPDGTRTGEVSLASHYTPLIGPYDSADPAVIEFHLLTMKLAGIDGVIIDWYGMQPFRDYALLHRNALALVEQVDRFGMRFAVCYEDQTVPALVEAGRIEPKERVKHVTRELAWVEEHWFSRASYLRLEGKPVLLSFGQNGLSDKEWTACIDMLDTDIAYFSEHLRRTAAVGAFDWPIPLEGLAAAKRFHRQAMDMPSAIPAAYPRFVDVYEEAGLHASWGRIADADGSVLRETLSTSLQSEAAIVQIVTWNDWGEGTMVEPSREFGYRDLEIVSQLRARIWQDRKARSESELSLPLRLLKLRRQFVDTSVKQKLDLIAQQLAGGEIEAAREAMELLEGDES